MLKMAPMKTAIRQRDGMVRLFLIPSDQPEPFPSDKEYASVVQSVLEDNRSPMFDALVEFGQAVAHAANLRLCPGVPPIVGYRKQKPTGRN